MSDTQRRWSTADLELYADDELEAAPRDALTEDLRRDPALRARLGEVTALDGRIAEALAAGPPAARRRLRGAAAAAAAAVLVLAAGAALFLLRPLPLPPAPVAGRAGALYQPGRVVISFRAGRDEGPPEDASGAPAAEAGPSFAARFDAALAGGDVGAALELLASADAEQRAWCHARISTLFASAAAAEALLDRMPPGSQLALCGEWVGSGHLRRVAFRRLRLLSSDAEVGPAARRLVRRLAEDPRYESWVRSYFQRGFPQDA